MLEAIYNKKSRHGLVLLSECVTACATSAFRVFIRVMFHDLTSDSKMRRIIFGGSSILNINSPDKISAGAGAWDDVRVRLSQPRPRARDLPRPLT